MGPTQTISISKRGEAATCFRAGTRRYRAFVEAGTGLELENPTSRVYGGMIIGRAEFIKEALRKLKEGYEGKAEISHRRALRTALMRL